MEFTLPSNWYTCSTIFNIEIEQIFSREWICAGRCDEIPNPGDHEVLRVSGESVLIVRNQDNQLRAFYNVCRHRGSALCLPPEESKITLLPNARVTEKYIKCPYHAWSYDLDGNLINAPHMNNVTEFNKDDFPLHTIGCLEWGGFFFLNLTSSERTRFDQSIADVNRKYSRYPLDKMVVGKEIKYSVNANWKVLCENYNECYHCVPVHPELCNLVPAFKINGGSELDWEKGVPHREGADTFSLTGVSNLTVFEGLSDEELTKHKGDIIYPNLFLSFAKDHVAAFILKPIDYNHTEVKCLFLFDQAETNKPEDYFRDVVDFWDLINRQDWEICSRVQQGLKSRAHERGLLSPMEDWNLDIRHYVSERIGKFVDVD